MARLRFQSLIGGCPTLRDFRRAGKISAGVIVLLILAGCRNDMHDQPRFKPLAESDFYPDLRSERQPVEGTVARGQLHEDTYFYTGMVGDKPGDYMPFPVTQEVLDRGRQRFDIFCAPCHSRLGDGNGMIPSRGFQHPPTYHSDRLRKAPLGYFFYVMTTGFGAMPDYAEQVPPSDRWCIVAYIRALQLSQNATQADVGGHAVPSPPPQLEEPGSGATPPVVLPQPTVVEGIPAQPPPSTGEGNQATPPPGGGKKER
ncbi:MAG TPA: cytochrome c [Terriglobales bacterium]|nr:cytochrome c [Terriglobales bacterium]